MLSNPCNPIIDPRCEKFVSSKTHDSLCIPVHKLASVLVFHCLHRMVSLVSTFEFSSLASLCGY